jgi:hypothetical protein
MKTIGDLGEPELLLRQIRWSPLGTKLKISSSAINRGTKRSASLKSCFRPCGARLENPCANCKLMCGSSSSHTDRQYWAVDSITASSTPCSRNHFLPCVRQSPRPSSLPPGVKAAERTRKKLHTVTSYQPCYFAGWRDTDWFKTRVPGQTHNGLTGSSV